MTSGNHQKQPPVMFYKKGFLRNFVKFTGNYLCQSPNYLCFPVNFAKFLRTPFLQNIFERLLLNHFTYKEDIDLKTFLT